MLRHIRCTILYYLGVIAPHVVVVFLFVTCAGENDKLHLSALIRAAGSASGEIVQVWLLGDLSGDDLLELGIADERARR